MLEPGDLLYLPPGWAHEGVAVGGDCMTCSIGLRAPQRGALARELVQRLAETYDDPALYRDARQPATAAPAAIPAALRRSRRDAVRRLAARPAAVDRALGEVLSEPKPRRLVHETRGAVAAARRRARPRTRMLYDARHVFINGESVPRPRPRRRADAPPRRRARARRPCRAPCQHLRAKLARGVVCRGLAACSYCTTRRRSRHPARMKNTFPRTPVAEASDTELAQRVAAGEPRSVRDADAAPQSRSVPYGVAQSCAMTPKPRCAWRCGACRNRGRPRLCGRRAARAISFSR